MATDDLWGETHNVTQTTNAQIELPRLIQLILERNAELESIATIESNIPSDSETQTADLVRSIKEMEALPHKTLLTWRPVSKIN